MIADTIKNFNKQFSYDPQIVGAANLPRINKFLLAGMGGSNLVSELIKIRDPQIDIIPHRNYGLPSLVDLEAKERMVIANSYSGNTEETIDVFLAAANRKLPIIAVSTGGQLLEIARGQSVPYVQMPNTGIQPRSALGFNLRAILKVIKREDLLQESSVLVDTLKPIEIEPQGRELAKKLKGKIPVIYTSERNLGIAYNWKIKFNESAKIPAFYNVLPELNHNEMTGFDVKPRTKEISKNIHFVFIKDAVDHPQIQNGMEVLEKLYRARELNVETIELQGDNVWLRIFSLLVLVDWTAYYLAQIYGVEPEQVPMVEEYQTQIAMSYRRPE